MTWIYPGRKYVMSEPPCDEHPLTAYRRRHNLTLVSFAARVPTTESTMSRIENRVRQPTIRLLRLIVAATGNEVSADEIIDAALCKARR